MQTAVEDLRQRELYLQSGQERVAHALRDAAAECYSYQLSATSKKSILSYGKTCCLRFLRSLHERYGDAAEAAARITLTREMLHSSSARFGAHCGRHVARRPRHAGDARPLGQTLSPAAYGAAQRSGQGALRRIVGNLDPR